MLRKLLFLFTLFSIISVCCTSYAQDKKALMTKFYNFDDMLIDGAVKKPSGLLTDVRKKAEFDNLLGLQKRSFIPELIRTAKERNLK